MGFVMATTPAAFVERALGRHAEQTGLLVASAVAPATFARSLGPRSVGDQAFVTGVVTALTYATTVATQDALAALAAASPQGRPERSPEEVRRRLLAADLIAVPVALAVGRALPVRDDEALLRSVARQAAWRAGVTGLGSLLVAAAGRATGSADRRLGGGGRIARLPLSVPTGVLFAAALEWRRRRDVAGADQSRPTPREAAVSLVAGLGVTGGLTVLALGEERLASSAASLLARRLPTSHAAGRLAGHALVVAGLGGAVSVLWTRAMRRVESGASTVDAALVDLQHHTWLLDTVSGSADSRVSWELLGREGRRHVVTAAHPRPLADRPPGVPDLSIPTVTGRPAVADPVEVYVSLDAAATARERVELALAEMDRTKAWERSLLVLVCPTGSGYVNYCAAAAVQYLTAGDVAMVTLQYSKRPSPLSLGKIGDAREQNRLLWSRIAERLRDVPAERRPRVVLFGESLGAHVSQDVFLHWGTLGLRALGIDRALWVGTPYSSGWMQEVISEDRPDTDPDVVAVVNDFGQIEAMPAERRARLRYVLLSHDNDGVTKFGADLLQRSPRWLREPGRGVAEIAPYSPRGVPAGMRWRPVVTFFQLVVDMKNAQTPGAYLASRHDYRPELARFVNEVYALGADDDLVRRVEAALEQREQVREGLFA
jgi:uncharacterized membrane protein